MGIVSEIVEPVVSAVEGIPRLVVREIKATTTEFTGIATVFKKSAQTVEEAAVSASDFIRYLVVQEQRFKANEFRQKLLTFNSGLVGISEELPRHLPGGMKVTLPFAMEESFVKEIVLGMPKVALFPLAEACETLSGWENLPDHILHTLKQLPGPPGDAVMLSRESTLSLSPSLNAESSSGEQTIIVMRTIAQMLVQTLKYAKSALPRDTSVNADVVGEGGGTEVCANPAGILLETGAYLIGMVDTALGMYQGLSKAG